MSTTAELAASSPVAIPDNQCTTCELTIRDVEDHLSWCPERDIAGRRREPAEASGDSGPDVSEGDAGAPHSTTIHTSCSGLSHRVRCTDCGTTGPWRSSYEEAWDDATRHELLTTSPSNRSFDDSEMLELLGRCDLLDRDRERRVRPTIETTPGLNEAQPMALWEYRRAETLYEEIPLDEFPSGPGQKGSTLHSRRFNRLKRANEAMLELDIGHLR